MIAPSPATGGIEGRKVRALQGSALNRMVQGWVPRNAWVRKERKAPQKTDRPDPAFGGRRARVKRRCKRPPVFMVTWIWANPTREQDQVRKDEVARFISSYLRDDTGILIL